MKRVLRTVPWLLIVLSLASLLMVPRSGITVPLYAARQGLMCGTCHFDPNGGGPRNEFGFNFEKNRHSMVADTSGEWKDLTLVNRVGDNFPLYFGLNQRFMLLADATTSDHLDRLGFFNMESSIHMAFQPHQRLALVYSRDGFDEGSSTKEAFGKISGFPLDGYIKAGRFRNPFGLRLDDHTVATRQGFLDFYVPPGPPGAAGVIVTSFLPYDPRFPDTGVEIGGTLKQFYGRIAATNGGSHPLFGPSTRIQTFAGKFGINTSIYQSGISIYDDWHAIPTGDSLVPSIGTRATRWGYYGLWHVSNLALIYEVAAGTDDIGGFRRNSVAWFSELDYRLSRGINVRGRFDRMELYRGSAYSALNTHNRYALEGEFDPVPFAQLRWTLRYIDHAAETDPFGVLGAVGAKVQDERQAYLQFHFFY